MSTHIQTGSSRTIRALLWMSISNEPFVVLYAILPFIMRKDLNASLVQLSILASLRPVLSIFSFYWSANLTRQKHRLRSNLISAWGLARLPFLFVPWVHNAWYVVFCCAIYELLNRSGNPALMEILKINLKKDPREQVYSLCFVISFLESILLGFVVTSALGHHLLPWQTLFGMAALISLTSIIVQFRIPIAAYPVSIVEQNWSEKILHPWRDAFHLLRSNPHFFRVQCGFMFGGVGLMLAAPSLSLFCVDILALSHTDITLGRSVLMGIGVAVSAYFWKKMIAMEKIDQILRNVLLGFSLYLLCLCVSYFEVSFFYLAYVLYGLSQAGSHLLWNLSGPMFAKEADSAQYTRVNILMVGLRGSITPAIGGVLCHCCGPAFVILLSAGICLAGVLYMTITQTVIGRRQKQLLDH